MYVYMERERDIKESIFLNSLHPHEKTEINKQTNKKKKTEKEEKVKSNATHTSLAGKLMVLYHHYYVSLLWLRLRHSMLL